MRVDRDAAAVVGDGQEPSASSVDFDAVAWPATRLVHGIVEHFGGEVVQRALVGAADVHAGAAAHRLEPFEHLDIGRRVAGFGAGGARGDLEGRAAFWRLGAEQVAVRLGFCS